MTHAPDIRFEDPITELLFSALGQARAARKLLEHDLLPLLAHTRRPFSTALARRCVPEQMFAPEFLRDLDAFLSQLDAAVAAGTHTAVHCDPDTGTTWDEEYRTDDANALAEAAACLRALISALERVEDAKQAEAVRGLF
ncbi:hypothetical protein ACVDG3_18765 [Meridianimarinicoccus sp. RP-17]|uniref:hypothetical protein n=1 Tax=Meridianimarinicoccus zhengii TaxID=2056810 RepID=UPI000DAD52F2|nr:hypothetical protein [Phycocomes zhengii]